jgi:hypothetical protein
VSNTQHSALAALESIPVEAVPAAIATLAARLLTTAPKTDDTLLTAKALAKELDVSVRYVWKNARALGGKRLPSGRGLRFPRRKALGRVA